MASSPRRNPSAEASTAQSGMSGFPQKQGMYNPAFEKDACGLAMVATLRDLLLEHKTIDAKVLAELAPETAAKKGKKD